MKKYVVDASVVIRALLMKDSSTHVSFRKILEEVEAEEALLFAPSILWSEVANGLRFSVHEAKNAADKYLAFSELPFLAFDLNTQHYLQILDLSYQLQTTIYDTTYHQVALLLGGTFLTSDKKYFEQAQNIGSVSLI